MKVTRDEVLNAVYVVMAGKPDTIDAVKNLLAPATNVTAAPIGDVLAAVTVGDVLDLLGTLEDEHNARHRRIRG